MMLRSGWAPMHIMSEPEARSASTLIDVLVMIDSKSKTYFIFAGVPVYTKHCRSPSPVSSAVNLPSPKINKSPKRHRLT